MATIPCTVAEFNAAFCEFHKAIGDRSNTQAGIANMYKCLVLHYLGTQDATDEEIKATARTLELAQSEAMMRGWNLVTPDLSGHELLKD